MGESAEERRGGDSTYLSTQTDWRADARPEVAGDKCRGRVVLSGSAVHLLDTSSPPICRAAPAGAFYFSGPPAALGLIRTCDLSNLAFCRISSISGFTRQCRRNNQPGFHQHLISGRPRRLRLFESSLEYTGLNRPPTITAAGESVGFCRTEYSQREFSSSPLWGI